MRNAFGALLAFLVASILVAYAQVPAAFWGKCLGPYVLCAVANCSIRADTGNKKYPLQAECGCLTPESNGLPYGASLVTPNIIKREKAYKATLQECFGNDPLANGTCTAVNSMPACKAINNYNLYPGGDWPLISTYRPWSNEGAQECVGKADNSSIMAECMTAACYKKTAWDGSPYTCFCPVVTVPAGEKYGLGFPKDKYGAQGIPCDQPRGYIPSGEIYSVITVGRRRVYSRRALWQYV
ncbi:hypothetical protein HYH03_015790 [Edaphochlamys debaryana]|uniref:Uncharacterized protein n=1 Tax=Edaphochlamys debaryana TaxID=47281 RepID=A0A836BSA3_9CHLO|nr:hypothetical protein HYH03_015790 [Edaphochlamys debaryana]|eukprot:KAG2485518.1 hypothetical protein HYH03_015790 [Edaphochlamys debaryana]